jgi:SAM-dependent methyltransferase
MEQAEFDQFADEYRQMHASNIAITGEGPEYFAEYKIRVLASILSGERLTVGRIIDFGAGIGNSVPYFRHYFPTVNLTCADVSQKSLDLARTRFPGREQQLLIEGSSVEAGDATFDVAFSACVFHHIPEEEHVAWLRELRRIVRPGGRLAVFEHNPLNALTVRAVRTCPFDVNARLIRAGVFAARCRKAGWSSVTIRYHVFFPRALAALRAAEPYLAKLPFGAQYSVIAGDTEPAER